MYALADCNNFFVSCERVFRPDLQDKPVVVLSGNDGCVISRSNEAKALGIPMGVPLYQIRELVQREQVVCFSSNFSLYGDLSTRVMNILGSHTSHQEQYSIDECFINIDHIAPNDQKKYCEKIVQEIYKGVGIPISIGIASSKTLAKVASKFAKKHKAYHGVCEIRTDEQRRKALSLFDIGDVWGIGRRSTEKLKNFNINTALDLADQLPEYAQNVLHKPGLLTWQELNGQDVIDITSLPMKQSITTSRTFAKAITDLKVLEHQLADFCAHCARQLRMQHSECQQMLVYAHTSRFRTDIAPYYISECVNLPVATASTQELLEYAMKVLRKAYKPGVLYKKAGIILLNIIPEHTGQQYLFDTRNREKENRLQQTLDHIQDRYGKRSVVHGSQFASKQNEAEAEVYKQEHKSPLYTTDLRDIITLKA